MRGGRGSEQLEPPHAMPIFGRLLPVHRHFEQAVKTEPTRRGVRRFQTRTSNDSNRQIAYATRDESLRPTQNFPRRVRFTPSFPIDDDCPCVKDE